MANKKKQFAQKIKIKVIGINKTEDKKKVLEMNRTVWKTDKGQLMINDMLSRQDGLTYLCSGEQKTNKFMSTFY